MEKQAHARKKFSVYLVGLATFCGLFAAASFAELLFTKQLIHVEVLKIDAPRSCRSSSSILAGKKQRTSKPKNAVSYCGYVATDVAYLRLPESSRSFILGKQREELWDKLETGCFYELEIFGYGRLPSKPAISNRRMKTIFNISKLDGC